MPITREFTKDELMEADYEEVGAERSKYGTRLHCVFEIDGAHWMVTIDTHPEDGWQIFGTETGTKAHKVSRTVETWEPVA